MPKLLGLILLMLSLHLFCSTTNSTITEHFDYLDVHELIVTTRHHQWPHDIRPTNHVDGKSILNLVHRDVISRRKYSNHSHRIDELIKRDAHRASFLINKLTDQAYNYHLDDFGSDVVSGLDQGSGEYFVRIGVGSPPRDQFLVIDTGSDIVWVQCQPCVQCYRQADPVFNPSDSASFIGIPCGSPICGLLPDDSSSCRSDNGMNDRCRYKVSYGDGSYTKGTLALETLTFGSTTVNNVAIGCGHHNRGLFIGAAGLLGLGWGPMSFVGQLRGQVGGGFSYCLASRVGSLAAAEGTLVFGRSAAIPVGAVWVPLLQNPQAPSFYYVGLVGLGVGGAQLPVLEDTFQLFPDGGGGVVMDTGTAVTRLPDTAYEVLRDAFETETRMLPGAPEVSIFDTCYDLSGYGSVRVPTVSFYFDGGVVLTLPARNFLIPVDDRGTFCFAFAKSGSGLAILGNIQQEGIRITVDSASGFVGFGPDTC